MAGALRLVGDVEDDASPDLPDEANLIARAIQEPRAFAPLYDRYADTVYRYCLRRLGNPDAAADGTGQVFAKALAALPRYRGGCFGAWLFAIARNVVTDELRTRGTVVPLVAAAAVFDRSPSPEERAIVAERARQLRAALAQLPDNQRQIVELRLFGLTCAEVARELGLIVPAVKSAQMRAFARLRRHFGLDEHERERQDDRL